MLSASKENELVLKYRSARWAIVCIAVATCVALTGAWIRYGARSYACRKHEFLMFQQVLREMVVVPGETELPAAVIVNSEGRSLYSWRFSQFVRRMGIDARDYSLDCSWNSTENAIVSRTNPVALTNRITSAACIAAVVGDDAPFLEEKPRMLADLDSDQIVIVSVTNASVEWAEPGDLVLAEGRITHQSIGSIGSMCSESGPLVGFRDGTVWRLTRAVPIELLELFMGVDSAWRHDRNVVLGRFRSE